MIGRQIHFSLDSLPRLPGARLSSNRPAQPTIKQQRAEKRAAQLAKFKKQQAAAKRNRLLGIIAAVAALLLVAGTVTTVLILNADPQSS